MTPPEPESPRRADDAAGRSDPSGTEAGRRLVPPTRTDLLGPAAGGSPAPATGETADPDAPLPFRDFILVRQLGRGGMGTVHEALQRSIEKRVALKVLRLGDATSAQAVERFFREARAAARLRHPNIVDVHGIGRTPDGGYFIVMDLIDGTDLGRRIARAELEPREAARIGVAIANAVEHAHRKGILHRDLKPSNVLLADGDVPVLTDFGLAKQLGQDAGGTSASADVVGTPCYMAPEQADPRRGRQGPWTDVYGLGGILYALLTRHPPYDGESFLEVLARVVSPEPPRPPQALSPRAPSELAAICMRCLAKDPAERYRSAGEVARDLSGWLESEAGRSGAGGTTVGVSRPVGPALAAVERARPSVRVRVAPERPRAGEPAVVRVEVDGAPVGAAFKLALHGEPDGRSVPVGGGPEWEGVSAASFALGFQVVPTEPGPVRWRAALQTEGWTASAVLDALVEPRSAPPFVGRGPIRKQLTELLLSRGCGLIVLRGESGVGKSRLAEEVAFELARGPILLLEGKCRRTFRFPLQPFRDVFLSLVHRAGSDEDPGLPTELHEEIRWRIPEEPYIADHFRAFLARDSVAAEHRAMGAYYWLRLLRREANRRPIVLLLDDIQWADAETLDLVSELLGIAHQRDVTLKVLATLQPFGHGAQYSPSVLDDKVRALRADRIAAEVLDLRTLDEPDLDALVDVLVPGNSFRRDLPWLYEALRQKTGGNPLFAEWVLKRLRSELAARDPRVAALPPLSREWFDAFVPREIDAVLDQRFNALSQESREALEVAAAVGDPFDVRLLERALGGADALDRALPALEQEELVRPAEGPDSWRFAHSMIPGKVYRDFNRRSHWRTSRIHLRIAEAMRATYDDAELEERALAYAHHLILANRRDEGLRHLLKGAVRLADLQLFGSAVVHLERAMTLVRAGARVDPAERARLLYRLGETYRVLGRTGEALTCLEEAQGLGETAVGGLATAIDLARGSILVQLGSLEAAEGVFGGLLSRQPPPAKLDEASAVSGLAAIQRVRGRFDEALRNHLRALELRESVGASTEVAISCVNVGNAHVDLGAPEDAESAYRRSLPIFEAKGLKNYQIYALSGLGNVHFRSDPARAVTFYDEAIRLCQEIGNRALLGVLHYNLGEIALADARYSSALAELRLAVSVMEAVRRRSGEAGARCRLAEVLRVLGDHEAAAEELARAAEAALATGNRRDLGAVRVETARLAIARGDPSAARRWIDDAWEPLRDEMDPGVRLAAALVLADLGDLPGASRWALPEGSALRRGGAHDGVAATHLQGLACRDPAGALRGLEQALESAPETYPELPRLLLDLAARTGEPRRGALLARAAGALRVRASRIDDPESRRRYLEDPLHRRILEGAGAAGR